MPVLRIDTCKDPGKWDEFVHASSDATNYHLWHWQTAIQQTYGHQSNYLIATDGDSVQGVLPLFLIRSWIFGTSLVSIPFFSYGGVLSRRDDARDALMTRAGELAAELQARHVELRQGQSCKTTWHSSARKVTMEIPLPNSVDELWKRLSSGLRNKVRNGKKNGFRVEWNGIEGVKDFYPVFAANMRNLGTPVYPQAWFENLCKCSPDIRILTLWQGDRAVAGAFLNPFRETLELPWSASLPETRKQYSQVLLYWTFLEWAVEHGYRKMDLGRCTPKGGTYEFKRHWGCDERPLHWYYWLPEGAHVPEVRPESKRYSMAVQVWKHLPLAVANTLGPRIVRAIP